MPHSTARRELRAVLAAACLAALVAACTHPLVRPHRSTPASTMPVPTTPVPTSAPPTTGPSPSPSPTSSLVACPDPTGHAAADAELLANRALDLRTADGAIGCLLTRSGIPIVSADTGEILNEPASPTFVDAYVYDFQIPMLAYALQVRRTWFLEDLWDLPDYLLPALGQPLTGPTAIADAVPGWVADALVNSERPSSFPALAVRALGLAHDATLDFFSGINPDTFGFDPVQFLIMEASVMSRTGTLEQTGTDANGCATFRKHLDPGPSPTSLASRIGAAGRTVRRAISSNGLEAVGGDITADLALLAGIDLRVGDNVNGHVRAPRILHDPDRFARFQATLKFESPVPGSTIGCGGLQGIRLPANGPVEGWPVGWTLVQDADLAHPAGDAEADKLIGSGGPDGETSGDGVFTNAFGHTGLKIVINPDEGCPDRPSCGRGPLVTQKIYAFVLIDVGRAPGFDTFLPRFRQYDGTVGELARKWLHAAVREIDPPPAVDVIEVIRHQAV